MAVCAWTKCGLQFIPKSKYRPQLYCSKTCCNAACNNNYLSKPGNRVKYSMLSKHYHRITRQKAVMMLGSICYFQDEFCDGPLEVDHKFGAKRVRIPGHPRKLRTHNSQSKFEVCRNPTRFLLLCRRHNRIKDNIDFNILPNILRSMLTKLDSK